MNKHYLLLNMSLLMVSPIYSMDKGKEPLAESSTTREGNAQVVPSDLRAKFDGVQVLLMLIKNKQPLHPLIANTLYQTALGMAFEINDFDSAIEIVKYMDNVSDQDVFLNTPLHYAIKGGNNDLVNLLCMKGANLQIQDQVGKTPLDYAFELKDYTPNHHQVYENLLKFLHLEPCIDLEDAATASSFNQDTSPVHLPLIETFTETQEPFDATSGTEISQEQELPEETLHIIDETYQVTQQQQLQQLLHLQQQQIQQQQHQLLRQRLLHQQQVQMQQLKATAPCSFFESSGIHVMAEDPTTATTETSQQEQLANFEDAEPMNEDEVFENHELQVSPQPALAPQQTVANQTALHKAIATGFHRRHQIARIANLSNIINNQDANGDTALHYAARLGGNAGSYLVSNLLDFGANPTIANNKGQLPTSCLLHKGNRRSKALAELEAAEMNHVLQQSSLEQPQFSEQHQEQRPISHELIRDGVTSQTFQKYLNSGLFGDLNMQDNHGDTAMHVAAQLNRGDLVQILIDNNANAEIVNRDGKTPLMLLS